MYLYASPFIAATVVSLLGTQAPMPGRADTTVTVTMRAVFNSHTSLRVSSSQLRFEVPDTLATPRAFIEFSAAARTYTGAQVVLTVEAVGSVQPPAGGPSADLVVGYEGEGENAGTLSEAGPHVAGRWTGSGVRQGRVMFTLLGATAPGTYLLPLKFVLSAP